MAVMMNREWLGSQKLQFYPTNVADTFLQFLFFAKPQFKAYNDEDSENLKQLEAEIMASDPETRKYEAKDLAINALYRQLVKQERFDEIERRFSMYYNVRSGGDKEDQSIVVADLFAGEGAWLSLFQRLNKGYLSNRIYLVANELEPGRYQTILDSKLVNKATNMAFEELQLPRHSVSIMLFNPPYTSIGSERSATVYFDMIVERKLMTASQGEEGWYGTSGGDSYMILVLRDSDMYQVLPSLTKNFDLITAYRACDQQFKQFVAIAKTKKRPIGKSTFDAAQHMADIEAAKLILGMELDFDAAYAMAKEKDSYVHLSTLNFDAAMKNLGTIRNENRIASDRNDRAWSTIRDLTRLEDETKSSLIMPRAPKIPEIANLLASGQLNSIMEMPDGIGDHIVIGGTRIVETESREKVQNTTGKQTYYKEIEEVTIIRKHVPFLNILVVDEAGKPSIKHLGGEEESEDEEIEETVPDEPENETDPQDQNSDIGSEE